MSNPYEDLLLPPAEGERVRSADIEVDGIAVPVGLALKEGATRLVVFYNGAVSRTIAPTARVFQRSSWAQEVDAHCLYVCDPSLYADTRGSIGWSQVDETRWGGTLYPKIVAEVSELIDVQAGRRLHYGSSAGGYQALVTAAADKGSQALVNNPQTDWFQYNIQHVVESARARSFPELSREEILESYDYRVKVWRWFEKCQNIPEFTYLVNTASETDTAVMADGLLSNLTQMHSSHPKSKWTLHQYFNEKQNHNPLGKPQTLAWINSTLSNQ